MKLRLGLFGINTPHFKGDIVFEGAVGGGLSREKSEGNISIQGGEH